MEEPLSFLQEAAEGIRENVGLRRLFKALSKLCANAPEAVVLLVDEVDRASNNQIFPDFLSQLRAYYLHEDRHRTFWSVVLAGVYDIKNLRLKIRPDSEHQYNSPWNIAADFNVRYESSSAWTKDGVTEAVKDLLMEPNTLSDDMVKKLNDYADLKELLYAILLGNC